MTRMTRLLALLVALPMLASGCALTAGAAGGAIAGSEIAEEDDEFDPLENTEVGEEIYDE